MLFRNRKSQLHPCLRSDVAIDHTILKLSGIAPNFVAVLCVTDSILYNAQKDKQFSDEERRVEAIIQHAYANLTGLKPCNERGRCHGGATFHYNTITWDAYVFRAPLPEISRYYLRPQIYMNQNGAENVAGGVLAQVASAAEKKAFGGETVLCNVCRDVNLRHIHCSKKKMHQGRVRVGMGGPPPGAKHEFIRSAHSIICPMVNRSKRTFVNGCDVVRERCCLHHLKWGMVPGKTWGRTPKSVRPWHVQHGCDDVMGSTDLTNCPYTCTNNTNQGKIIPTL